MSLPHDAMPEESAVSPSMESLEDDSKNHNTLQNQPTEQQWTMSIPKIVINEGGDDAEARSLSPTSDTVTTCSESVEAAIVNELVIGARANDSPPEPTPADTAPEPQPVVSDVSQPREEEKEEPALQRVTVSNGQQSLITEFYQGKNILLTGATGFVGKAVLWKLIQSVGPRLGKIYLLIRNGSNKRSKIGRPSDRVKNEILNNKAFTFLRKSMGESVFDSFVHENVVPIAADLISPDLSLSDLDRETIVKNVQVVIHCAATLDYHERLDLALETNTLGTLRLMDLADECENMHSFVHMSIAYFNAKLPDGYVQERVYPMELGDPEELLKEIVGLELQDIPKMTQRILAYYPNTYTFTKFLTEHLILKRVDYNRIEEAQGGKKQWPIAIVRATQVGAGAYEPLPGWVDGVTGMNGAVFLLGHGIQVLQSDIGHMPADIIPVDYLTKILISSAAAIKAPGIRFLLPYNEIISEDEEEEMASPFPQSIIPCFPVIYQVSGSSLKMATWREIYDAIRHYWTRNTKVSLPTAQEYFVTNKALLKARMFMKTHLTNSLALVTTTTTNNNSQFGIKSMSKPTNRTIEQASRIVEANQQFLRHRWVFDHQNVRSLAQQLERDRPEFRISGFKQLDWFSYMVNYSFGTHTYIAQGPPGLRNINIPEKWDCALYSKHAAIRDSVIEKQIESVVFSASDIQKRTNRMLAHILQSLENPDTRDKRRTEDWVNDFDASLDDWCHDDSEILKDARTTAMLGRWAMHIGENDESIKVVVLNDRRVAETIQQIIESSGVPQQTVVAEAFKILQRMRERTQLAYIWFAGAFLDALFKQMFASIRIRDDDLIRLKEQIKGKNVVYVPVSKTILDQLLLWYICLRYQLPVPAIVCDEALALLGPISDILRITGAYFVRRDQASRSPLNTAVTAAYTEALLHEHGALSMLVEKARSRTGRLQAAYDDGIIDMILDATLEKHQQPRRNSNNVTATASTVRDTVFVPINITYEKIPELHMLIDQVLDQKQQQQPNHQSTAPESPKERASPLSRSSSFLRPSVSVAGRNKENGADEKGKYGRVYIGIGNVVDVRRLTDGREDQRPLANTIAHDIQTSHHRAAVVSPVALVAAVVLYGRASDGISMGSVYELVEWLRNQVFAKGISMDWQGDEDVDTMVAYAMNLLDSRQNIIIEGKRITENSNVRVVDHADNVMALSYMANQLVELFLAEALFCISYLSMKEDRISRNELFESFDFLFKLLKGEFIYPWDHQQKFDELIDRFVSEDILAIEDDRILCREANNQTSYTHICLFASLLYPTLDAYWITSCSLSALRDIPFMPRKIVPVLSQWIAAHLISGRRTIYREVLSKEASQNALDNFLAVGFIDVVHPKTKLSPDAQILLLELGVTTNENLVMDRKRDEGEVLADIEALCHRIERHRFEAYRHNTAQVFEKCQNQIRAILRAEKSYAVQHGMKLNRDEDQMIQLVYSCSTLINHHGPET